MNDKYLKNNLLYFIAKHGRENNVWYVDVSGFDQKGRRVWLSGNVLDQAQCGYGGFYDFQTAMEIIWSFEERVNYSETDYEYCSEQEVKKFIPKQLYIGYAPIKEEDEIYYQVWPIRAYTKNI